ncbi:hypothetical protein BZA70DRAFT_281938 [Myxozyma melibiosi]|uniref:Protein farnesyltransferase/geranylgeranyltransferase type-1 subunit alpha n=1 Tax=Myxozyma melibiosi TaxID=54550 RepID=A0ABR1F1R2_9ASCO
MAYLEQYNWDDIAPIPQNDGGENAVAPIAYSDEYRIAMEYLRAVMRVNEFSDRALKLTEDVIYMNAAHYTVWQYRTRILFALDKDLCQELIWVEGVGRRFTKNYQIWNHREVIIEKLGDPSRELPFIESMLELDSKNYHVWSYRQWLVRRFDLWATEVPFTDMMLELDVRNNSAWNHRFFAIFGRAEAVLSSVVDDEIEFTKSAIFTAPQNPSAWNYLLGVLKKSGRPLSDLEQFCLTLSDLTKTFPATSSSTTTSHEEDILSARAIEVLAEIYAERNDFPRATHAWTLLAERYDCVRENYWNFKKRSAVSRLAGCA